MGIRLVDGVLAGLLAVGAACAGGPRFHKVAYTPQPQRIAQPARALATLILANTTQGCTTEPAYSEALFIVKFVCTHAVGNVVLRPPLVESIEILQAAPWYRVVVHHRNHAEDFVWDSKSIDDAQHIADAVHALAFPVSPAAAEPPVTKA